ncbi:MAG: Lrp/AsnC ligand binding domain-containing protein [Candidatus Helarchaeota archaeon]
MLDDLSSLIIFNIFSIILLIISIISIRKRVNTIAILITAIMWGLIPWPFLYLNETVDSILTISFVRALISVIGGFSFIFVLIASHYIFKKWNKQSWFQYKFQDFKNQLTDFLPTTNVEIKNKEQIRLPYFIYYFFLGIFYIISVIFYFFSYKLLGIIFSAIINTIITSIIVAIWNLARRLEQMDTIKITYLLIFLVAGILTILSSPITISGETALYGLIALASTAIFWTLFIIISGFDKFTEYEKKRILSFGGNNTNFQITKSIVKVSFFFLASLISLTVITLVISILPLSNTSIGIEIKKFFADFQHLLAILTNIWTWILGLISTIIPYIVYFSSKYNWPSRNLKWDQWVAILAIFEPFTSIFVGFFIGNEGVLFNLTLLTIALILMLLTMLLRYYHEKNSLKSIILLKLKPNKWGFIIKQLLYNPNVIELKSITGKYDILLKMFFQSNYLLKTFIDELKQLDSVIEMENFIEFEILK